MPGLAVTDDHRPAARAARRPHSFTAASPIDANFAVNRPLQAMVLFYALIWAWSVAEPVNQASLLLENLMTVAALTALGVTYPRFRFSNPAYLLITTFLILHTAGGYYSYSDVPLGRWLGDALGEGRNCYDRVVHFCFGLLCVYPLREICLRAAGIRPGWATLGAVALVLTCSAGWEIVEWLVASVSESAAAAAYLGLQGDAFDPQKDMAVAGLGGFVAMAVIETAARRSPARRSPSDW